MQNDNVDNFIAPEEPSAAEREQEKAAIAALPPPKLLASLFRMLTWTGGQICQLDPERLRQMLARFTADDIATKALADCACSACKMRIDYIHKAAPLLLEVAAKILAIHKEFEPRARAAAERAERKDQAKAVIGQELVALAGARKLGWS